MVRALPRQRAPRRRAGDRRRQMQPGAVADSVGVRTSEEGKWKKLNAAWA
jgi:hypothetical protein